MQLQGGQLAKLDGLFCLTLLLALAVLALMQVSWRHCTARCCCRLSCRGWAHRWQLPLLPALLLALALAVLEVIMARGRSNCSMNSRPGVRCVDSLCTGGEAASPLGHRRPCRATSLHAQQPYCLQLTRPWVLLAGAGCSAPLVAALVATSGQGEQQYLRRREALVAASRLFIG